MTVHDHAAGTSVVGLIDFGDMVYTWTVSEIAIAAAYLLITLRYPNDARPSDTPGAAGAAAGDVTDADVAPRPLDNDEIALLAALVGPYADAHPLTESEWAVLPTLIASRIAMSLIIGSYSSSQDPQNLYLRITLRPGWEALRALRAVPNARLLRAMRNDEVRGAPP